MFIFRHQVPTPAPTPVSFMPAVGDWVKVFLPHLGVTHEGIVTNVVPAFGGFQASVIHNMKGRGVVHTSWQDFSEGQRVVLYKRAESLSHVQQILRRAYANLGAPYFFFKQNCQHYASFAFTGSAESPGVNAVGGLTLVAILAALFG
jgi:hypothetical protein